VLGHIISHFAARQNISLNNASFSAPLLKETTQSGGFFFGCRLWRGGVWSPTTSGGSRSFFVCRMDIEKNIGMWYNNDKGEEALCIV